MAWGGKTNLIEVVTQSHGTFVVAVRGYQRWKEKGLPWESISGKSATQNEANQMALIQSEQNLVCLNLSC